MGDLGDANMDVRALLRILAYPILCYPIIRLYGKYAIMLKESSNSEFQFKLLRFLFSSGINYLCML
jgi:hypothetical protein